MLGKILADALCLCLTVALIAPILALRLVQALIILLAIVFVRVVKRTPPLYHVSLVCNILPLRFCLFGKKLSRLRLHHTFAHHGTKFLTLMNLATLLDCFWRVQCPVDMRSVQRHMLIAGQSPDIGWIVIVFVKISVMTVIPVRLCINTLPAVIPVSQHVCEEPGL